ncbi:MAG: ABC transporter ATP-binding protein [Actinomycetota bacterium]|jgi:branched-chain amino acid transport system ATP-binding protein|nr:ABC transporter ATP-binding protein [Actinomycetota bacterium]
MNATGGTRALGEAQPGASTELTGGPPPLEGRAVALELDQLTCRFGFLTAVSRISLTIPEGSRFGIIGPNGAGKTTLFNLLSGELHPTEGTVALFGRDISRLSPPQRVRLGMGRTFQVVRVFNELTVRENLTLALTGLGRAKFQLLRPWRTYGSLQARVAELATSFGLGDRLEQTAGELSHGELRELEVLLALAVEPRVLLLDEPAAGLSPAERVDIQALLQRLPKELTIVMIEHDMQVLRGVVDWVAVLDHGELVTQGPTLEVQRHPRVRELYLGSAAPQSASGDQGGATA